VLSAHKIPEFSVSVYVPDVRILLIECFCISYCPLLTGCRGGSPFTSAAVGGVSLHWALLPMMLESAAIVGGRLILKLMYSFPCE
jgi:hypothetical protein